MLAPKVFSIFSLAIFDSLFFALTMEFVSYIYWQCCNKPAYTMREIKMDGRIRLFGCGSWNGYYGSDVRIDSTDLKDIHQPDELFIDPRYESRW